MSLTADRMNEHTSYALVAVLAAVGTASLVPAFAELPPACPDCVGDGVEQAMMAAQYEIPVTVWTDSAAYDHESVIMVEGKVANTKASTPVTLTVRSPSNNLVEIRQLSVDDQGGFSTSLSTVGDPWKYDGTYTIRVQYGSQEVNNKVLVELSGGEAPIKRPIPISCSESELSVGDSCVPYSISGGMITEAGTTSGEGGLTTLIIGMSSMDDGMLSIEPMRQGCGEEGDPIVLVDGEQWDDYTFDGSSMSIMFPAGTGGIEITGTCVVPEFGAVAALVLAVAIVSIIAVTARSRLSVMPRF